jgi:hypothetical protein
VTDFLDVKRKEIADRLKELEPLVSEFNQLEAAVAALAGVIGSAASQASAAAVATVASRRGPGRPRGSSTRKKGSGRPRGSGKRVSKPTAAKVGRPKGKAGRPKGGGKRATQALSLVRGQPGITIPELAAKMGIKQNYLYRVLPGLEQEGKLEKKGRGWHPKA